MRLALALVVAATLAACSKSKGGGGSASKGVGIRVADDGEVTRVTASPDGKWLAFLGQVERPKELGVPQGVLLGLLEVASSSPGPVPRPLLGGVTNMPGNFAFSPDSKVLAALKGFRFATHTGTLEAARVEGGEPVHLADDCANFVFSPDSQHLAWVAGGGAFIGEVDGSHARRLTDGAATLDFARDSKNLLVRRTGTAGGELLLADVATGAVRTLAKDVGDYVFSPNGADVAYTTHSEELRGGWTLQLLSLKGGAPRTLGEGVVHFVFAPDGAWIAYVSGVSPSHPLGDLYVALGTGAAGVKVGERVENFTFAPDSHALAMLEHFDSNSHAGILTLQKLPPDQRPLPLYRPVMHFEWSPGGNYLAFTAITLKPAPSVDLQLISLASAKPGDPQADGGLGWATGARKVQSGVYNYEFLSEQTLLYRTDCVMEGRACDLFEVPTDKPALPARITGGVWRFQVSKDGTRMLVTYPRVDSETVADLGAINLKGYGGVVGLDKKVEPGASFLDAAGTRVGYGVIEKGRNGVYVAEVPLPDPAAPPPASDAPGVRAVYPPAK